MNLTTDARIFTADREDIGNLNRFVLDPKTRQVTNIVFERGTILDHTEYVLPMEWVDHINEEGIFLKPLPMPLDEIPAFEEEKYVITDEEALLETEYIRANPGLRMYYYYPPATYTPYGTLPPDRPNSVTDARAYTPEQGVRKEIEENIPDHTVALKEGAKVWSLDAKHIGDVEKVFIDPENNKATHLLLTKGLLFKERKLVPIDWVDTVYEDRVDLVLRSDIIDNLPDYQQDK